MCKDFFIDKFQVSLSKSYGADAILIILAGISKNLSHQLYEEALHVQFYLTLLDNYIPDQDEREEAFAAIHNIPSIRKKADFCFKWMGSVDDLDVLDTSEKRKDFLMNLICFASCIEGLFFFGAFAYVYFLRDQGLLDG